MKDYLSASEKNQFMVLMSILQVMDGHRNGGIDGPKIGSMLEEWTKRNNMTKEEHKSLKTAGTYLEKFTKSIFNRLSEKEREGLIKRLVKFDFRLVDDYTLEKVSRDINNKMINAVVPRQQFNKWCEEIMCCNCKNCTKNYKECELHEVFEENFIPESSWNLENCRYAYRKDD